jgi:soluble lytic murein transglycosylase
MQTGLRGEGRPFWVYAYPRAYENTVVESSKSASVPEEFIWGIMRAESHFRQDAQSAVGALGLMQLMPFTGRQVAHLLEWKGFETPSLLVPENNIKLGTRYLQRLLQKFSGSIPLAAASYNAGPHRVHVWVRNFGSLDMDEFIEHIPFVETRNYVKKVVRNYQIYSLLYGGGGRSAEWLARPVGVVVEEKIPTREIW